MARYDKYDPKNGGFRAALLADRVATTGAVGGSNPPVGVGLDSAGKVTPGAGNSGVMGVLVLSSDKKAGDIVDVMTDGEIVEFGGTAGTSYFINNTTGAISTTSGAGTTYLGTVVEAGRLVVRCRRGVTA